MAEMAASIHGLPFRVASASRVATRLGRRSGLGAVPATFRVFRGLRAGAVLQPPKEASRPLSASAAAGRKAIVTPSAMASRGVAAAADSTEYDYDLFCIGAGSGGVRASRTAAGYGAKVAVCEMPFATKASDTMGGMGGTCVIRGCVPKKLLVYGSHFAEDFEDSEGFGWSMGAKPTHDWAKLIRNKNTELNRLTGIYGRLLEGSGVDIVEGRGKLVDNHTVEVAGTKYTAKHILIAVGGRTSVPDIPGAELAITSDDALELPELPKKVVVVGGGYIALEFAGIFNAMGSEVHLVFRQPLPLRGFDEEVRQFMMEQLEGKGIYIHAGASPTSLEKSAGGFTLHTDKGELEADQVMFATGRKPNVANLGLENVGVELAPNGAIKVDEYSKTSVDGVWAVGDVTDRINLTPVALMEGMAFAKTAFLDQPTKPDHTNVACAVFSQPPVATVGLTEEEAAKNGDIDVYTSSFRPMKATLSGREEKAFMKLIVDVATDKVVGVHMVGGDGPEIMQGIGIAVKMGATKADFDATVGIHPTAAEELVTMRTKTRTVEKTA